MPVIDGKVVRSRYQSLKLAELSSVDRPAQPGALATIMKRADGPAPARKSGPSLVAMSVAKYVGSDDGAHTFAEVLSENKFSEAIWPMTDALSQSIRSIVGDKSLKPAERETKITTTVDEFLAAVRGIEPEVEKRLAELISKRNPNMHTIESLTAKVEELTGQLASANTLAQTEKARADKAEGELATEKAAHVETRKALTTATDEVITVDGTEIRKSAVGDASFTVTKALMGRAQTAELEKRATDEFGHVVGTATEKALVLKAASAMDEPTRKALDAILTSAEKMAAGGFGRLGGGGGVDPESDVAKAQGTYATKVAEIEKRDGISNFQAMQKARLEFPAEFAAAYPDRAAA